MTHESDGHPATHRCMGTVQRVATLGLILAPLACDPLDPDPTMGGELQRGNFEYRCAGSNDAFCEDFVPQRFPQRFAVEGSFEVVFNPSVDVVAVPSVESSSPTLLNSTSIGSVSELRFVRPGTAALIATINGDEIVDYLHITAERVLSYNFSDDTGGRDLTEVVLEPGESRTITVEPRGELGQLLAGTLEYTWSTDDPSLARVASDTGARSIRVEAVAPGSTRLLVEGGEVSGSVQVFVEEASSTTTDLDPDTESSGSTGDSTTTTSDTGEVGETGTGSSTGGTR